MPVQTVQPAREEPTAVQAIAPEAAPWIASGLGPVYDQAVQALQQLHGAWWGTATTASGSGLLYNCTSSNSAQVLTLGTVTSAWPQLTVGATSASNTLVLGNVWYQGYRPRAVSAAEWRAREADEQRWQAEWAAQSEPAADADVYEQWRVVQAQRIAAAEAERARRQEEQARRAARMQVADDRAARLLRACLSAEQQAELDASGIFHVTSKDKRRFRIEGRVVANVVEEIEVDGVWNDSGIYCCHPRAELPVPDVMLAQALHIQHNLEEFLRIANRHR